VSDVTEAVEEAHGELSLARVALAEDDLGHAANHVGNAIGLAPELPEAHELLAALAARTPDGGLALFPLDRGYVGTIVAHAHLLGGRDPERALDLLAQASRFDPERPWADAAWVRALDVTPLDPGALTRVFVSVMMRLGEPAAEPVQRANEVYLDLARRAVLAHPDAAVLHGAAAGLARRFGQYPLAVTWGERGYRLEPSKLTATWYAYALRADGRLDDALAVMAEARQRNPLDLDLYADASSWLAAAGRLDEALAIIDEAMRIDPTYDCAVHTAHRLRFQRDGDPQHLIELSDFIREAPADSHEHTDLADACDRRPWLGWPAPATEAVINALAQAAPEASLVTMSLSALEVPSAIAVLRRASPGIDLSIGGPPPPEMTGPRQPGPVLWRYDGSFATPAVDPPAPASTSLLAEIAQPWWAHPVAAYDHAMPLGALGPTELLALLVHPPACPPALVGDLPPGWWERSAQAFACLGILHCTGLAMAARLDLLTGIAYGMEDWTTETALFALTVAAWTDPECRAQVRDVVGRRFVDAVRESRDRAVTIVDSLAQLARITPGMPDEVIGLANDVLAAPD
jgi:tetratricopeptide (TPR) repeat protein